MKKKLLSACLMAGGLLFSMTSVQAEDYDGVAAYREMLDFGGNPAELTEMAGEELWFEARGPKKASLEKCDLGLGPGVIEGAYAQLPRYFPDVDQVMDLESRLLYCMETLQGLDRDEEAKKAISGGTDYASDMESLVAYVVAASRGVPINVPQEHAKEIESYQRGEQIFFHRAGRYDFACASCPADTGQRIRLPDLHHLSESEYDQQAYSSWPVTTVS